MGTRPFRRQTGGRRKSFGTPSKASRCSSSLKSINVTPTKLTLAASVDDIQKKVADIELTMNAAIPAKLLPKEGRGDHA